MESASKLMRNTVVLAAGSILLRFIALFFQSYLSSEAGAGELGLFGLISSVGIVFSTIAISGIRFATTRLVSQETSLGNDYPGTLMKTAFVYALILGLVSAVLMYACSEFISRYWIASRNANVPLKIMSLSMPFISIGATAEGYFTAKQKIFRIVASEIIAQLLRIVLVAGYFEFFAETGRPISVVLAFGFFAGEASLSVLVMLFYVSDIRGRKEHFAKHSKFKILAKTAMPLAISAYMRTGLSSLGHVIIPRGLRRAGMGAGDALVSYGIITQMALPVVMFPSALLNALGEILVPRLTSAQIAGTSISISYIVNRALRIGIMFSFGIMGAMYFYAGILGNWIYSSQEAGTYIKMFAPLLPVIYIDCVVDGCLKGLGQQVHSMMYNVLEGVLNVVLLTALLPVWGVQGYIITMYVKEIFNAFLSIRRLAKITCVDKNLITFVCVMLCACLARMFTALVFSINSPWILITAYLGFYASLLYVLNAVSRDDIKWILSLLSGEGKNKKYPQTRFLC